jgi:ATP-dependent Clp protease ATP-binding subunit ClpA
MNQQQTMNPANGIIALETYGIDLTQLAQEGKIDPVIGRENEIEEVFSRWNKVAVLN